MKSNRKYIYASIIFALTLIFIAVFIYVNSANYIKTPQIILPTDNQTSDKSIEYKNNMLLKDVVIDTQNYKDVILKLSRPEKYTMIVTNDIYAYDVKKSDTYTVLVMEDRVISKKDDIEYQADDEKILITQNRQTKEFARELFSDDDIMGIPTYEQVLDLVGQVKVSVEYINHEQTLKIEYQDEDYHQNYYISLVTGILVKYENFYQNMLIRQVTTANLSIQS